MQLLTIPFRISLITSIILFCGIKISIVAQETITFHIDSLTFDVNQNFTPGVFYVPKTDAANEDFLDNNLKLNSIRSSVIESALNYGENLEDAFTYLDFVSETLKEISLKTDYFLFIFEKMPPWLSSSTDSSPAQTPGWAVLHTKPPKNYEDWYIAVQKITDKIVNEYGINNAHFEFWNEPDIGSWTGTQAEYFKLYKSTYDAIKSIDNTIPVGGTAVNYWANNISYQPPYGYVNGSKGNKSLIAELIDSTESWNKPLDFISWHNFNITHHTHENAQEYIYNKYKMYNKSSPPLIISEWNTMREVRETPLQKSFFIKSLIELSKTNISKNMVAAWQDFHQEDDEFIKEYGLLSFGAIHKPVYKALQLADKLSGTTIKTGKSDFESVIATITKDTLYVLQANYTPPPFVEALNHTLFEGKTTINQLDSSGYIDIANDDIAYLESIYKGEETVNSSNFISTAINNSIQTYQYYSEKEKINSQFIYNLSNNTENYTGKVYKINSTSNNSINTYYQFISNGATKEEAVNDILEDQSLKSELVEIVNGKIIIEMEPNSVHLYEFIIPGISTIENNPASPEITLYPNPSNGIFQINSDKKIGNLSLVNTSGQIISQIEVVKKSYILDLTSYPKGMYYLYHNNSNQYLKLIKY